MWPYVVCCWVVVVIFCGKKKNEKQVKAKRIPFSLSFSNMLGSNAITFDTFLVALMRPDGFKPAGNRHEFINGFKVFDKDGSGYIAQGELRYVLTNLGEKLSDAEVDELLKGVEVDSNGRVNYEIFVDVILSS